MLKSYWSRGIWILLLAAWGCAGPGPRPPEGTAGPRLETNSVERLVAAVRESIVVVTHDGRDGREAGVGAGFVISADGLVATSLHVIGEGHPVRVQFADGRRAEVTEIHATDRKFDLAILRVEATGLKALKLGDSDLLKQGAPVVAIGNPLGLERSVVQGVVSARRDVDGVEMIQLAIPIEPGNSGGPLLDLKGRVHGVLTLKSALTPNLGFAMPGNYLKALVNQPNPIPMNRWLARGALNPQEWTPTGGARWSRKAGRIAVEGAGVGFGGRSLCLAKTPPPARPYEIAVSVKLDDEAGAAGLVFGADGGDRHYGFYPSAGNLRLTRFDGPNVFSWQVLKETPSAAYRRGEWNQLRVRVEADTLRCFVNGQFVCEAEAGGFAGAAVGLAKFRDTRAEFRQFGVGTNVGSVTTMPSPLPADLVTRLEQADDASAPALAEALQAHGAAGRAFLTERARQHEREAARLRELAALVNRRTTQSELALALSGPEAKIDLFYAALLVAKHDQPDLDVEAYRAQLREMAGEFLTQLPAGSDGAAKLAAVRRFLFTDQGFHGSRGDFHNRANSYLNRVLDDREGLPITLAVLFLELAREIGLERVSGLPLPGHFMVQYSPATGPAEIIDVFNGGKTVTRGEAQERVFATTGEGFREAQLRPAAKREIIVRMLRNLQGLAEREGGPGGVLRYVELIVALSPDSAVDRLRRAQLRLQARDSSGAKEDLKWILDRQPEGVDLERVAECYRSL